MEKLLERKKILQQQLSEVYDEIRAMETEERDQQRYPGLTKDEREEEKRKEFVKRYIENIKDIIADQKTNIQQRPHLTPENKANRIDRLEREACDFYSIVERCQLPKEDWCFSRTNAEVLTLNEDDIKALALKLIRDNAINNHY